MQLGAQALLNAQQADNALVAVKTRFVQKTIPLRVLLRALCLTEKRPLSLDEIEQRALANGYRTKVKNFRGYLRRVLRESEEFTQVQAGWTCNFGSRA